METLKTRKNLSKSLIRSPRLKDLPLSVMLFLLSRANILGGFPFIIPFFATLTDKSAAYIYLPVMLLGTLSAGGNVLKYFLASFLFWLISEFSLREPHPLTSALYCGLLTLVCGFFGAVLSDSPMLSFALLLSEAVFSGVMYTVFLKTRPFFKNRYSSHVSKEEIISFIVLISALISGLSGIVLPLNINIAQIVGVYLILCTVCFSSLSGATVFSVIIGFASAPLSASSILLMGYMAAGTIFSSLLKQYGKYGILTGFFAGILVSMLYTSMDYPLPVSIISLFTSAVLFLATPGFIHSKLNRFFIKTFYPQDKENDIRIKSYISGKLKSISKAFKKLSQKLHSETPSFSVSTPSTSLFENVASRVCTDCPNIQLCWRDNLTDTCRQMFSIIDVMEKDGVCTTKNMPVVFSGKCRNPEKFILEFNHVYEMYKEDLLRRNEEMLGIDMISRQYADISSIIKGLSQRVEYGFYFIKELEDRVKKEFLSEKLPIYNVTVMENSSRAFDVYLTPEKSIGPEHIKKILSRAIGMPMKIKDEEGGTIHLVSDNIFYPDIAVKKSTKDGESVSGDTVLYFESDNNLFYVILADGMGSGKEAQKESMMTAGLLKEFILAGVDIGIAIDMINSSLSLKTQPELFSTVDILEINLLNGEGNLYKVGGAQSYIKCKGQLETILSKTLPIGIIDDIKINHIRRELRPEDMVVLVSDGVSEADFGAIRGEWIKKIMAYENRSSDEISTLIIENAKKRIFPNNIDDMTVISVKLMKY